MNPARHDSRPGAHAARKVWLSARVLFTSGRVRRPLVPTFASSRLPASHTLAQLGTTLAASSRDIGSEGAAVGAPTVQLEPINLRSGGHEVAREHGRALAERQISKG